MKATVGKVIDMMNLSFLSPMAWNHIVRGAVDWDQHCYLKDGHPRLHYILTYPNGYSASIVKDRSSYGYSEDLWELAVLKDDDICYDTDITNDVCGYLTEWRVVAICDKIYNL